MKKILFTILSIAFLSQISFAQCSDLFISEYVEGSGNNKAIEIYNPSTNSISLANYRLIRHDNGNSNTLEPIDPQHVLNLPPNITMPPKTVYVMALNLTDPNGTGQSAPIDLELQAVADTLLCNGCGTTAGNSRVLCFNGDDALALQKNVGGSWVNIDIFACIGEQPKNNNGTASPTAGWTILPPFSSMPVGFTPAGAYFLEYWTQDKTLSRKYDIQTGVTVNPPVASFDASVQWDSLPTNTFDNLGAHECICNVGLNEIANRKMDYEFDSRLKPDFEQIYDALAISETNARRKSECTDDYFFVFIFNDELNLAINANQKGAGGVWKVRNASEVGEPRSEIYIDRRYLLGLLTKQFHWNNAEVGSQYGTRRIPNKFDRGVQRYLNFLAV